MARNEFSSISYALAAGRRLRGKIFRGPGGQPAPDAETTLAIGDDLARKAGQIALAYAMGTPADAFIQDLDQSVKALDPMLAGIQPMVSNKGLGLRTPDTIAAVVLTLAQSLYFHIDTGIWPVTIDTASTNLTEQDFLRMLDDEPDQFAPLTADTFALHAIAAVTVQLQGKLLGRSLRAHTIAVSGDGSQVVLPDGAPKQNWGVYFDGTRDGQTHRAALAALQANAQQP